MTEKDTEAQASFLKRKRKPIFIILFILLNVAVIAATASAEFGNSETADELSTVKINWWFLVPATICFVVAMWAEVRKYYLMIKSMTSEPEKFDKKHAWKIATRTVWLGKYYDNITPAAVGGQPFQIYYMRKNSGLKPGVSTAIPMFGLIAGQVGFLIIAVFCFLFGSYSINNAALIGMACFGLIFFAFWPLVVLIATFLPKGMIELINLIVKGLARIHVVKNKEETIEKVEKEVQGYAKSIKQIMKQKGLFTKVLIYSVLFNVLVSMIPFFVLTAFGGDVDFLPCFVLTVAVTSAIYFVPTPGSAGAAEGTFFLVFSALSTGYVFWAMLIWRFFVYYVYILAGPVFYVKMHLEKKKEIKSV